MICRGVAVSVLVMLSVSACAAPDTGPATVPAGCEATDVRWSAPQTQPRLTRVTLYRGGAGMDGRVVLDDPFTPAITGVTAPADWIGLLAVSLAAETGVKVETGPATLPDGGYGVGMGGADDPGIPYTLFYEGAVTVSAEFSVECSTPVTGVFTSWTTVEIGGLACGSFTPPQDVLGPLALTHCPATPAPRPSGPQRE